MKCPVYYFDDETQGIITENVNMNSWCVRLWPFVLIDSKYTLQSIFTLNLPRFHINAICHDIALMNQSVFVRKIYSSSL